MDCNWNDLVTDLGRFTGNPNKLDFLNRKPELLKTNAAIITTSSLLAGSRLAIHARVARPRGALTKSASDFSSQLARVFPNAG